MQCGHQGEDPAVLASLNTNNNTRHQAPVCVQTVCVRAVAANYCYTQHNLNTHHQHPISEYCKTPSAAGRLVSSMSFPSFICLCCRKTKCILCISGPSEPPLTSPPQPCSVPSCVWGRSFLESGRQSTLSTAGPESGVWSGEVRWAVETMSLTKPGMLHHSHTKHIL